MPLIIGGGIAFFVYYFQAMVGYLGVIVEILFFSIKTYAYQIPATSLNAMTVNFGFILLLAIGGIYFAFKILRANKKISISLSFTPQLHCSIFLCLLVRCWVLPAVSMVRLLLGTTHCNLRSCYSRFPVAEGTCVLPEKHRASFRKNWVKALTVTLIVVVSLAVVVRSDTVYGKILEAATYYSTTDIKAYDAGVWLRNNYPENATVVVTRAPGFWFQEFSDKSVIAQTDPVVGRNEIAEAVLSLSYELENPQTLVKAYEAKGDISDENYVSLRSTFGTEFLILLQTATFCIFTQDGISYQLPLSEFKQTNSFRRSKLP